MRSYRCWAEVDLNALRSNLAWIRHHVGPETSVMTVVKADAYGHGLRQIAALLMQSGTDIFGAANLVEAQSIRSVGKGWPILLLGPCLPDEVDHAAREDLMPTVSTGNEAENFSRAATRLGKTVAVHLKVDTGMGRLGCDPAEAAGLARAISRLPGLRLEGIYTHYSAVEDDTLFSRRQRRKFEVVIRSVRAAGISPRFIHADNSGALLVERTPGCNLVRPGLLVYGIFPPGSRTERLASPPPVTPALSWKCRVGLVREVRPGASISYGRTFVAKKKMRLATLTAGYGDGFLRAGSNRAEVILRGRRCRVVGRVTMDQTVVDVSSLEGVERGEVVTLIGAEGEERISATELAGWCGTIPWEILTSITYRVPRVFKGAAAS